MELYAILSEEELANALFQLSERAKMGNINGNLVGAIDDIITDINERNNNHTPTQEIPERREQNGEELRNAYRMRVNQEVIAIFEEQRVRMDLMDVSNTGFGLSSEIPAPQGENIHVEINGMDGMDIFRCQVCFCSKKEGRFQVGVRILKKLPRL